MRLTLHDDLIVVSVTVAYQGREVEVPDMVVDTGSATTIDIKGILGLDFLLHTGAIINLGTLQIGFGEL
jgi:hypothetical protein